MNLVYSSTQYQVVEYPGEHGGFEVINHRRGRQIFLQGESAARFRASIGKIFAGEPTVESVGEFLGSYDLLMNQPAVLH